MACAVTIASVVTLSTDPAQAATCGANYYYGGQGSTASVESGIQGELGRAAGQTLESAVHIINYYDQSDTYNACNGIDTCWLQGGYGHGEVGGKTSPDGMYAYGEHNDENGYFVRWSPASYVPLSAYISVSYVGRSGSYYHFEVDSYAAGSEYYLANAYFSGDSLQGFVNTETEYHSSGTCATQTGPYYYGANANGDAGTSSEIETSYNNGSSWGVTGNAGWNTLTGPGLNYATIDGNRYAFKVDN